jgi:hypothetical protein
MGISLSVVFHYTNYSRPLRTNGAFASVPIDLSNILAKSIHILTYMYYCCILAL